MPGEDIAPVLDGVEPETVETTLVESPETIETLLAIQSGIEQSNMLLVALIACILAFGLVRSLLGWLHG